MGLVWKVVLVIINFRLTTAISFHDMIHGLRVYYSLFESLDPIQGFLYQASKTLAPKHIWIKLAYRLVYRTVYQGSKFRFIQHSLFPLAKISG